MTEDEWQRAANAHWLLEGLRGMVSERKLRLIGCGACRRAWHLLEGTPARQVVEVAEQFVDGEVSPHFWAKVRRDASRIRIDGFEPQLLAARRATVDAAQQLLLGVSQLFYRDLGLPEQLERMGGFDPIAEKRYAAEWAALANVVRDIIRNPFRPARFSSDWRTDTAVALARTIYDSREFGAMPILADALQDAGCDNEEILNHCRGAGPHVRGCWVVDLVLGKG